MLYALWYSILHFLVNVVGRKIHRFWWKYSNAWWFTLFSLNTKEVSSESNQCWINLCSKHQPALKTEARPLCDKDICDLKHIQRLVNTYKWQTVAVTQHPGHSC